MSKWTKFATSFYKKKRRQNKNYKFSQALTDAAAVYNGGNDIVGGGDDELVKQNGGGSITALNSIRAFIKSELNDKVALENAIRSLNSIDLRAENYGRVDLGASSDELEQEHKQKMKDLLVKLIEKDPSAKDRYDLKEYGIEVPEEGEKGEEAEEGYEKRKGGGEETKNPVVAEGQEANGGKKAKKSAKKGKKSAKKGKKSVKKGGKKAKKSAKKGKC
jgi:hypothetical protein